VASLVLILLLSKSYPLGKLLQLTAAEVFRIPASSMEPTLMGEHSLSHSSCEFAGYHSPPAPDRILAAKVPYWFLPLRRFDVVVFEFPLNRSSSFVKRVAGMPGEEFLIHRGDLYARPKGESRFRICRKPEEVQEAIWIDPDAGDSALGSAFERRWKSQGEFARSEGELSAKAPGARFVREDPDCETEDLRILFEVGIEGAGEVFAEAGPYELSLGAQGGRLRRRGGGETAIADSRIAPGRWTWIELAVWDGLAVARLDGREVGRLVPVEFREDAPPESGRAAVAFGARGSAFRVRGLRVGRDIHYRVKGFTESAPVAIPEDSYFLMGDNVSSSHDSRSWRLGEFVLKDGRTVRCEDQEVGRPAGEQEFAERHGLAEAPDLFIGADEEGRSWGLYREDPGNLPAGAPVGVIAKEEHRPFPFVERRFIKARVQKVWWPLARARPVR
jgi:signal peptidase I